MISTPDPQARTSGRADPPARTRVVLLVALILSLGVLALTWPLTPHKAGDAGWYERLADGRADEVPRPFANRVLAPRLAARISETSGGSLDLGFRLLGIVSIVVFIACLTSLMVGTSWRWRLPAAALSIPFTLLLYREYYLADLPHAALLALSLLALARRPEWIGILLLTAVLTRESTLVFIAVLTVIAWRDGRRGLAWTAVAAGCLGAGLTWWLSGGTAQANVHGIGALPYIVFKLPFNLLGNVLGLVVWVNTIHTGEPLVGWDLPAWLQLGSVVRVGIAEWNPLRPLYMTAYALSLFGLAPSLLWRMWRCGSLSWNSHPLWLRTALAYGLLMVLAMPLTGSALPRLLGYGWPAMLIAVPLLAVDAVPRRGRSRLLALHLGCAWLTVIGTLIEHALLPGLVMLALAVGCHAAAWRMLQN